MSYRLVYTARATKDIRRLDDSVKTRIGKALERYSEDPLRYARRLSGAELGNYRFRIGNYRVIFDLLEDEIVVLRIGHRSTIYRD